MTIYQELLDHIEDDILPDDPLLPRLSKHLRALRALAKKTQDRVVEGHAIYALARIAEMQEDLKGAYTLSDQHLIAWCRRWHGPVKEAAFWGILARTAPTLSQAQVHAQKALQVAQTTTSLYAQIHAYRNQAKVALRAHQINEADLALQNALTLAQGEGLQPQILLLLHERAELPNAPRQHAEAALALAKTLMRPRDEARALLNLLNNNRNARHIARITEIVDELGSPKLRARKDRYLNATR